MHNNSIQRQTSIKDIYEADSIRVTQLAEEKIREAAYRFAMHLKQDFVLADLEKPIQSLALQVRALDMVESGLREMLDEINER